MAFGKVTLTGASETLKAGWTKFNSLIDDLLSTTAGKGASQIGITDAGLYMSSANVEDALQEIYADTSTARTLSGTFEEDASTTTGLTWGYTAGTVRFDNTVTVVAAGTISLTDDATNYIEINSAGTVSRNTTGFTSGRIPVREVVCASGVQTTSTDKRSWFQSWDMPLPVAKGGTGAATLTDHGILLGSGTGAVTPLGAASNGQIPIGSTGADPVLAGITGTANQITVTDGAGTITLSIPDTAAITFSNTGLHLLDTNASHDLIVKPGSDLTEDRILTITTGDAARTITLNGNLTVGAGGIQAVRDVSRGLVVVNNATHSDHQVDVDATEIMLQDSSGVPLMVSSVNLTIDIAASGANGLDTGSEDTSKWYDVYVASNGSTTIGLLSVEGGTFTPPAGYTYSAKVSAVYNNSAGDFEQIAQYGHRVCTVYTNPFWNGTALSGVSGTVDLSAWIPATAKEVKLAVALANAAATDVGISFTSVSPGSLGLQNFYLAGASATLGYNFTASVPIAVAQTIYCTGYASGTVTMRIIGWEY